MGACPAAPKACPLSLQCKMDFHACSTGKSLSTLCDGPCPCLPEPEPPKHKAEKNGEWIAGEPLKEGGWAGTEGVANSAQMPALWCLSEPQSRSSPGGERGLLGKYCGLFRDSHLHCLQPPLERRRAGVFELTLLVQDMH